MINLLTTYSITRDNASNINSLIKAFQDSSVTYNPLVNTIGGIRCLGHIINLVVNSFLKELAIEYNTDYMESNTQSITSTSKLINL